MNFESLGPFIPLILLFVIFYFLLIRPQQKQQKKRQEMLKNLKKGDRIVTIGGIYGIIKEIDDTVMSLRVADNLNLKFSRASVDRVIEDESE
jgi:preprotein translocase subunit YajC